MRLNLHSKLNELLIVTLHASLTLHELQRYFVMMIIMCKYKKYINVLCEEQTTLQIL